MDGMNTVTDRLHLTCCRAGERLHMEVQAVVYRSQQCNAKDGM